ncbi:MAG: DUF3592 domain-containing protein [Chlamydiales bacterium]|nr:DUF3592 domain-containing protein [Chlamydiia bacterium]MCP5507507.1 DUF3592 domain-containing protein [Chlamydiales bacterium]
MKPNSTWLGLIALMALITLWFSWGAAEKLIDYIQFNKTAGVVINSWSVEKIAEERYALKAEYSFNVNEKKYQGETIIDTTFYRNPWAAEEAIPMQTSKAWKVWYAENHPETSALQHKFPLKETLYAAVLWVLLLYFIWLGYYVARKQTR